MQTQKLIRKVQVKNRMGLHTRPATEIVRILHTSRSQVSFTHRKEVVDARSVLNLLMLAAGKNAQIIITVEGIDAEETMHRLVNAFEIQFGEEGWVT